MINQARCHYHDISKRHAARSTQHAARSTQKTESTRPEVAPKNADQVKKAVALGKEMKKGDEVTKVDVARAMYDLIHVIHEESREVIVRAFIEGANLTPKDAQTYF